MLNILNFYQKINRIISYLFSNHLDEKKFLRNFFKSKLPIFIDVGSNNGTEFDFLNGILEVDRVYMFDPSKYCYNYLNKKYLDLIKSKSFYISNLALSNVDGERLFYEYNVKSQSSFYKFKNENKKNGNLFNVENSYNVKTITLDNFCRVNDIDFISYLKIDAQDEDLNVLKGSENLLIGKAIHLIKVEITVNSYYESNTSGTEILNYLSKFNYKLINIGEIKYDGNQLMFFNGYFQPIISS